MKAYLTAGFSRKDEIAAKCKELESLGVTVTATWPWEPVASHTTLDQCSDSYLRGTALVDIADIDAADTVILFTQDPTKPFVRGGRMHEFGYAHGKGKSLIVIGPRENIFHYLPDVEVFHSWEAFLEEIKNGR